jgi:hypothetical protein
VTESSINVSHRLAELNQVAEDLRHAREMRRPAGRGGPNRVRVAVGRAFLAVAAALLAEPRPGRLVPR